MTEVKIIGGKLTVSKNATSKGTAKPTKYPYPATQYDALLKLAKSSGVDVGSTKAQNTKAANAVTRAIIDDFIGHQHSITVVLVSQ